MVLVTSAGAVCGRMGNGGDRLFKEGFGFIELPLVGVEDAEVVITAACARYVLKLFLITLLNTVSLLYV